MVLARIFVDPLQNNNEFDVTAFPSFTYKQQEQQKQICQISFIDKRRTKLVMEIILIIGPKIIFFRAKKKERERWRGMANKCAKFHSHKIKLALSSFSNVYTVSIIENRI